MKTKQKIRDGFSGEKVIYIPEKVLSEAKEKAPALFHLYITQVGYFPKAARHYRERKTGCHENIFIYCVQGKGHCILDNKTFEIHANQYLLIPATDRYVCYWADDEEPWTIYWLHYASDQIDVINCSLNVSIERLPVLIPTNQNLLKIWNNIFNTLEMGYSQENLISASFSLHYFLATFLFPERHADENYAGDIITKSVDYMRQNIGEKLTVEDMASRNRLSVSHFSRLFRQSTAMPPLDYFIHLKMQKACQLLYFGTNHIKGIALELGYDNPYYFSRLFKKSIGVSPRQYRQQNKIIG